MKITGLLFIALLAFSCNGNKIRLKVLPEQKISNAIIGNGVQWSAYPHADSENAEWGPMMTSEKWNMVFDRLDYIKPAFIRVMDQAGWRYYKGVDSNNQPIIDFSTQEVKSLYKLLDYCESRDITVVFGEWGAPGMWGEEGEIDRADDERWINMIVSYLKHLILEKNYTCLKYYNLVNEPNGYWASTNGDWEQWKRGAEMLDKALHDEGLIDKIQISGPDVVANYDNPESSVKGVDWVSKSVEELSSIITCYDVHAYPSGEEVRSGYYSEYYAPIVQTTEKTGFPIILGELGLKYKGELYEKNRQLAKEDGFAGPDDSNMFVYDYFYGLDMADALIQSMNVGFDGVIAWDLDDAMHTVGDKGEVNQLKRWGMWNSLGTELCNRPSDEDLRPWFYTWSLMCRYIPAGSDVIEIEGLNTDRLRAVATMKGDEVSISIINNSDVDHQILLDMSLFQNHQFNVYTYEEGNCKTDSNGFPVVDYEINTSVSNVKVAAKSFKLITTYQY